MSIESSLSYSKSKALYHVDKINDLKKGKPIIPTTIQIDPEMWCNDNCGFCSYRKVDGYNNEMLTYIGGKPSDKNLPIGKPSIDSRIPSEILLSFPQQMVDAGVPAVEITGGGEPTLHPDFEEFYRRCGECKLDVALVTNGSRLTDRLIEMIKKYGTWIRISMDSSNAITHKKIHHTPNSDFGKRISSIKKLVANKPEKLIIGISFIITPDNYDDIESAARLFASIGVDHIRFSWMFDKQGTAGLDKDQIKAIGELVPKLQKELDRDDFKIFNEKNRIQLYTRTNDFKRCDFQRFVVAIGGDCGLYPCCIMKYNKKFQYGNLKDHTLKEIVESWTTDKFMKDLDPLNCYPCWLGDRNKSITDAVDGEFIPMIQKPMHENFI